MLEAVLAGLEGELGPRSGEPVSLDGGITNRNLRVRFGDHDAVVRLPGKETALLGIDREAERAATVAAAATGVGPEVLAFLAEPGCLVTGFIAGRALEPEDVRAALPEVAAALRAVHAGPPLPSNFIHDGTRVRILDWEYAGMGDRYFDLGNLSVNNGFSEDGDERLLAAYGGEPCTRRRFAALRLMRIMSDFREGMWGVVQTALSELDFDFVGYADEHLGRVGAAFADPRVGAWLEDARG